MAELTKLEFISKHGVRKPSDKRERDMIILSNLSDFQINKEDLNERLNALKAFIIDTEDVT